MTATISSSPTLEADERSSSSSLRLALVPVGSAPALLDGAWWPRCRDLGVELPSLTAVLDPLWGRITRITVNPTHWPVVPRKVPVAGHVVKVGWFLPEQDPHELLLLSYHVGRWNLLVVPPQTTPVSAAWLMAAASDPLGTSTASRLMEEAARLRTVYEADRAVEAVWDSEGGHEARDPAARPRISTVTATVPQQPMGKVRTVDTFMTVVVILAMIALGVLLIHLLNSQHSDRIAAFHYGRSGMPVAGPASPVPRKARGRAGASGTGGRRDHRDADAGGSAPAPHP